jgi:16S rRNA processing protein RimM
VTDAPETGATDAPRLLEVGRITKAHGLRGEVVVTLTAGRAERVAPGAEFSSDIGTMTVRSSRPHQDRWVVTFDGVEGREGAEALRGLVLRGTPIEDPETLWVHDLIGCTVRSRDGVDRGVVESVMDNPAADLLVLDTGALVPVVFVVGTPHGGVIEVDTPDGLFELAE